MIRLSATMKRKRLSKGIRIGLWASLASLAAGSLAYALRVPLRLPEDSTVFVGTGLAMLAGWIVAFFIERRRRRKRQGRAKRPCINCGYELLGNISGVCPECGEVAHYRIG